MDRVGEDHEPLVITRNGKQSVVMISLDDYKALEESTHHFWVRAQVEKQGLELLAARATLI